ncbi:uncharacterized protein TNCV_274751 [Trichonephila clavipes]|nr:uncharacterized protein TNCV_274751 [Trichonephila clavipes]
MVTRKICSRIFRNVVSDRKLQETEKDKKELEIRKLEVEKETELEEYNLKIEIKELEENEVNITDIGDSCEVIDILIGAKVMEKMLTSIRKILSSGLVAVETCLGWTIMTKSQVAPLRCTTIPRMELQATVIEARLTNLVLEVSGWRNVMTHYWNDSTTVFVWILREENWSVFIKFEIKNNPTSWR